jgi:predicted dehydrogenase
MASAQKVVAALVGAGFMGSVHSRALRAAGIEIAGVLSSSTGSTNQATKSLGIPRGYGSLTELLEDQSVNLVHVLTPNHSHSNLVAQALEAGKNVICEKPLTIETRDAVSLATRAKQLGLIGAIPFVYRYHAMAREARSRVQWGELGQIFSVRGEYLQDWLLNQRDSNWRVEVEAGGRSRAFADIGIHLCDLIEFVTGQRITRLVSNLLTAYPVRSNKPVQTEDVVTVLAQLEGGAVVSLMVSQVAAGHKNGLVIELHGASEALRFEQEQPDQLWIGRQSGSLLQMRDPNLLSDAAKPFSRLPAGHPEGYMDAFTSFVKDVELAILGNTPSGLPTFQDGVRSSQLTDAVMESADCGGWVEVS